MPKFVGLFIAAALLAPFSAQADQDFTRFGDVMQIALPLAAFACAVPQDRAIETASGYFLQALVVRSSKHALGNAALNQRPDGTGRGFPSGHTTSAMYGATNLAEKCYPDRPLLRAASYGMALAVGLSRIDADRHTAAQVAAGMLLGYSVNGLSIDIQDKSFSIGYSTKF